MYTPFNKKDQLQFYGDLYAKFLSWNLDEIQITQEERQEMIELFQAHIEALKQYK